MTLAKMLYFYTGSVYPIKDHIRRARYIDTTENAYDPFEGRLLKGKNTRSRAIQDYGLTIGYFAPKIDGNLCTHNVYDQVYFEIVGTRDALLYIFPCGSDLLLDDYAIRIREVTPMWKSERIDHHIEEMQRMKEWMQDIHQENLRRINMGYCDYDE